MIKTEIRQTERWQLTKEGAEITEYGSHEARVFEATDKDKGILHSELMVYNYHFYSLKYSFKNLLEKCSKCKNRDQQSYFIWMVENKQEFCWRCCSGQTSM